MPIADIVGQSQVKQMLKNALQNKRVAHAYLFHGLQGTGKLAAATIFAQALFCENKVDDACGVCLPCRRIAHRNHSDVHWIEPDGASIKIEQVRLLQKDFAYRAAESGRKVYIVRHANRMTTQAANSLLKFLEEPSSTVTAILLTENKQAVLPTIQSRVQAIPFVALSSNLILHTLLEEGLPEPESRAACQLVAGVGEAREYCQSDVFAQIRKLVIQLNSDMFIQPSLGLITLQEKGFKSNILESNIELFLDLLVLWFKDMIHIRTERDSSVVYTDQLEMVKKQSLQWPLERCVQAMEWIVEGKKRIRSHANPQLVMEWLVIRLIGG